MQKITILLSSIISISATFAAPLALEKRQQPFSNGTVERSTSIIEQQNAPWGLQRISDPNHIPPEIRLKSQQMAFTYKHDQLSGQGVDVYVVDGGLNITHPDFGGRAKILFSDFGDDGIGGGTHGTGVAGVIGGTQYGVAKNVNIWGLKCEMGNGDRTSRCLNQILLNHEKRKALPGFAGSVINMSFGSYRMHRSALETGNLTALVQAGVHITTSAGNDKKDACGHWPSAANQDPSTQSIISVGSTSISEVRAYYSNSGPCVDIYAPGWTITTTQEGGSKQVSGTSFASPAVAGVIASELALNPSLRLDPRGMKEHILSKGVQIPGVGLLVNTRIASQQ